MRLKLTVYILCIATMVSADVCDGERVYEDLVVYFHDWEIAKMDDLHKHIATGWRRLPSKGRAHYRIKVEVMVNGKCELKVWTLYQACSWAGTDTNPECNPIKYSAIVKTASFSTLAKRAVAFTEDLRAGLVQIAPISIE